MITKYTLALADHPPRDALGDVYLYLLQKAAERKGRMMARSGDGAAMSAAVDEAEMPTAAGPVKGTSRPDSERA